MGMKRPENNSSFSPCPEGQYRAVLCDVIDLGFQERFFEGQSQGMHPMVKLVWQVDEDNEEGKPYLVFDRKMKYSFHEKAALYLRLCAWLGKKKVEQMLDSEEELESLIGYSAFIAVEHSQGTDGTTYANVSTIMPLPKGMQPLQVRDYERWCERESWTNPDDRGNPPRRPEISAFEDPAVARRLIAEANGQQPLVETPAPSRSVPPQRAKSRPDEHPAANNHVDTRKAAVKQILEGDNDDSGEDDFAQDIARIDAEQGQLVAAPAANTAHR